MTDPDDLPAAAIDPTLAGLAERVTRGLQSGDAAAVEAEIARDPARAGALRRLLPTLRRLTELGRSSARPRR